MASAGWLERSELRVGLGCMRLSTDAARDDERARETIAAAAAAGMTVFDTARAYAPPAGELGHNERLLAATLRSCGAQRRARVVTKGGMTRPGGAWVPDGRAKAIRADCEASLAALDGLEIDLYLLHAPDPRVPWRTSVRALGRLADERIVSRVGLANVNRRQLDEALALAPIAAVSVALSVFDDRGVRGGVVERCVEAGIAVIAHAPLGGPRRAAGLERRPALAALARELGASAAEVALAWVLARAEVVVAVAGARRPQTARSAANAAKLALDGAAVATLDRELGPRPPARARDRAARPSAPSRGEVVLVMGIPGAGKSRVAARHVQRGYVRLNRDERGGTMAQLSAALEKVLDAGAARVVLDNAYLTRASRSHVVEAAERHGRSTRCVWVDTPLAAAQVNLVLRLLERFGALPTPEELRAAARREPGLLTPTAQMRALRELEPPLADEGFGLLERVPFVREPAQARGRGVLVAAAAMRVPGWSDALHEFDAAAPHLLFEWLPGGSPDDLAGERSLLAERVSGPLAVAVCPHGGGPPRCWCRPPLPGLALAFAHSLEIDPSRSTLIGARPAHRALASALGARHVEVAAVSPA